MGAQKRFGERSNLGSVLTCILSPESNEIVLIKDKRFFDPRWKLPGGSIEPEDVDVIAAAIRECREETGIQLIAAEVSIHSKHWRDEYGKYHPYFCIARIAKEKLDTHLKIGDENGRPLMVATFDRSEVPTMGELLDRHRPLVTKALAA